MTFPERRTLVTLEIDSDPAAVEEIRNLDLDINLEQHREKRKRSLDANGYLWVLTYELARVLNTSADELHARQIEEYSEPYTDEHGHHVVVLLRDDVPVTALPGYWRRIKGSGSSSFWMRLYGSSEMDTRQFSHLLDMVIEECKEQGIETLTPAEMERLKGYDQAERSKEAR